MNERKVLAITEGDAKIGLDSGVASFTHAEPARGVVEEIHLCFCWGKYQSKDQEAFESVMAMAREASGFEDLIRRIDEAFPGRDRPSRP